MMNDLSNMGVASVQLIHKNGKPYILKQGVCFIEFHFYQLTAADFRLEGIGIPELIESQASINTLLLEYIPYRIPQYELITDVSVMNMLKTIHQHQISSRYHLTQHSWKESFSEMAY